ncbi:hypothetical protein [Paenibacillus sp. HB172176]|uniref:hypothetical protein n=1 Tax=Paenibacillus sp. HB172176 TaxID=2493690 RepID=UPI00143B210F|nr:hypothetical protein [Paenibacillus sp. HB172176]
MAAWEESIMRRAWSYNQWQYPINWNNSSIFLMKIDILNLCWKSSSLFNEWELNVAVARKYSGEIPSDFEMQGESDK